LRSTEKEVSGTSDSDPEQNIGDKSEASKNDREESRGKDVAKSASSQIVADTKGIEDNTDRAQETTTIEKVELEGDVNPETNTKT